MDEYNIHGWTALHEASYKGYATAVSRFLNYAKETQKNLIEMKTTDDFKATPVLTACLGGHLDVIKLLVEDGANVEEKLQYKQKFRHGLIEIAVIKQDIHILSYLYDFMPNIGNRIRLLMIAEDNDDEIRSSIARTLEKLTQKDLTGNEKKISNEILQHEDFGRNLTLFLKYCIENGEALSSIVLMMVNVLHINKIREKFCTTNGINCLMSALVKENAKLTKQFEFYQNELDENEVNQPTFEKNTYLATASLGQALSELSKYEDCVKIMDDESYSAKIINFTKLLFDLHAKHDVTVQLMDVPDNTEAGSIEFEEYIAGYLTCVGNLVFNNIENKVLFTNINLYEYVLGFWFVLEPSQLNSTSDLLNASRKKSLRKSIQLTNRKISYLPQMRVTFNETDGKLQSKQGLKTTLSKVLKYAIIECLGKALNNNAKLKNVYLFSNNSNIWSLRTSDFINSLIELLDPNRAVDRVFRTALLKFISRVAENDPIFQNKLLNLTEPEESRLIFHLRTLLRKSVNIILREEAIETIYQLTGSDDYFKTQDKKLLMYKAISTNKFVDCLYDSDVLSILSLDALQRLANSPPHRDENNKIISGTENVAAAHAIPAVIRLIKSPSQTILFGVLKAIKKFCVSIGYTNNYKNQFSFVKLGALHVLLELCQRKNISNKLRIQAFYSMSSLALSNSTVTNLMYKNYEGGMKAVLEKLLLMLIGSESTTQSISVEPFDEIENRINVGMTICALCYRNDDVKNKLIEWFDKMPWPIFKDLLDELETREQAILNNKENKGALKDTYLKIQKAKCLLAFQMASLYTIIDLDVGDEDPRATGIKILIGMLQSCNNTLIRALSADFLCGLINTDKTLVEPIVIVDAIEILCHRIELLEHNDMAIIEIGNCSIALGYLTEFSAEARRRIIKLVRKVPFIMAQLKYYNKELHPDLLEQWAHYQKLMDMVKRKPFPVTKEQLKLPPIQTKASADTLNKLKNLKV